MGRYGKEEAGGAGEGGKGRKVRMGVLERQQLYLFLPCRNPRAEQHIPSSSTLVVL